LLVFFYQVFETDEDLPPGFFEDDDDYDDESDLEFNTSQEREEFITRAVSSFSSYLN
jgi:hypothetical protein